MPVNFSNYPLKSDRMNISNNDMKKQNLILNFEIKDENNNSKNLMFEMDKVQLSTFYEEIEKIQEKLDKLY